MANQRLNNEYSKVIGNFYTRYRLKRNLDNCVVLKCNFIIFVSMESKKRYRTTIFYKDYFDEFFIKQREKVKAKIIWTLELIEELERVPETYLKHIENSDGLFEIRVQQGSDIFRIFCFFDQG